MGGAITFFPFLALFHQNYIVGVESVRDEDTMYERQIFSTKVHAFLSSFSKVKVTFGLQKNLFFSTMMTYARKKKGIYRRFSCLCRVDLS